MNKIPAIRKGDVTTSEPGLPVKDLKKIQDTIKTKIISEPPITSHFQATIITPAKINAGML